MRDAAVLPLSLEGESTLLFHSKQEDRSIDLRKVGRILCERVLWRGGFRCKLHFYWAGNEQDVWLFNYVDRASLAVILEKIAAANPLIRIEDKSRWHVFGGFPSWWWPEA